MYAVGEVEIFVNMFLKHSSLAKERREVEGKNDRTKQRRKVNNDWGLESANTVFY
jgi:hypothetical protein